MSGFCKSGHNCDTIHISTNYVHQHGMNLHTTQIPVKHSSSDIHCSIVDSDLNDSNK